MPTGLLWCNHQWLPSVEWEIANRGPGRPDTPKFDFTYRMIDELPKLVVAAIKCIDDSSKLKPREVVIYPLIQHPWTKNGSTFALDLQPDEPDETSTHSSRYWKDEVRDQLYMSTTHFIENYDWKTSPAMDEAPPSFDIEVRPIATTGMTLHLDSKRTFYEIIDTW